MAIRNIKGIEESKIEMLVNLELEKVVSAAENLGFIPKQTVEDKKDLVYSLKQALILYTKSAKRQETSDIVVVYGGYDAGFVEREP